jgi:hypothetical protein
MYRRCGHICSPGVLALYLPWLGFYHFVLAVQHVTTGVDIHIAHSPHIFISQDYGA